MTEKTLNQEVDEILLVPISGGDNENEGESGVATVSRSKVKKPRQYKVLLHNDDYTTMDFVVRVLEAVFHKTADEAIQIMLQVHKTGVGICGVYSYEVAETKVEAVHEMARQNEFPLKASMEEV